MAYRRLAARSCSTGMGALRSLLPFLLGVTLGLAALPVPAATQLATLPSTLAQWYKPVNKRQVWLHTMFSLRRELQAVEEYAEAGEREPALAWSERFARHLRSIPEMVPEWRDRIEWDELKRLEHTLSSGNLSDIANQAARIRRDCRSCHREYRALAALRYRSPDFSGLKIEDGEGKSLDYSALMQRLSRTLNRIKIASDDARWEAAALAADHFKGELDRMATTCNACHRDTYPRERILGESSDALIDRLSAAIERQQPDQTGRSLGQAAVEICARCHATHRTLNDVKQLLFD